MITKIIITSKTVVVAIIIAIMVSDLNLFIYSFIYFHYVYINMFHFHIFHFIIFHCNFNMFFNREIYTYIHIQQ